MKQEQLFLSLSLSCLLTSLDIKLPLSLFTPDPNRPLDEYIRLNPRGGGGHILESRRIDRHKWIRPLEYNPGRRTWNTLNVVS